MAGGQREDGGLGHLPVLSLLASVKAARGTQVLAATGAGGASSGAGRTTPQEVESVLWQETLLSPGFLKAGELGVSGCQ